MAIAAALVTPVAMHAPTRAQPAAPLHADTAPSVSEIAALASALASADAQTRARAIRELSALRDDALPALRTRLSTLAGRLDSAAVIDAISAFRKVQGVTSPSDPVDLAVGVPLVLAAQRTMGAVQAAELVLELRALEAQKTPAAADLILESLLAIEPKAFAHEAKRSVERLGIIALPALVRHQNHARSFIRELCRETLIAMRMDAPGRAVQLDDVVVLSALLDAYGETLIFDAMPVIVSYVTDERAQVREAARRSIRRFGKNAIWQLRERYRNQTGNDADPTWGSERVLKEIATLADAPRRTAFASGLREAERSLDSGNHVAAAIALDRALTAEPHHVAARDAGPMYARVAAAYLDNGEQSLALLAYRRALRLAGEHAQSAAWKARARFLEAELRRSQGMIDLAGYREASALDPSFTAAQTTREEASGERAAHDTLLRRWAGFAAAFLLGVAGISLLRSVRRGAPLKSHGEQLPAASHD